MTEKEIRSWKKVYESDLSYISIELKDLVDAPALIILEGPLGAGKTAFTKSFTESEDTNSPTYSIINEVKDIVHADFYRIKNRVEILHLEIPLYLEGKNYFLVEWGKKHLHSLVKEIPEDFLVYILEISINDNKDGDAVQSRNFNLFAVKEL
jgi:tRNA threonylcarbamoyladenosine biosynthesis protein TsaE